MSSIQTPHPLAAGFYVPSHPFLQSAREVEVIIIPISQVGKLRLGDGEKVRPFWDIQPRSEPEIPSSFRSLVLPALRELRKMLCPFFPVTSS